MLHTPITTSDTGKKNRTDNQISSSEQTGQMAAEHFKHFAHQNSQNPAIQKKKKPEQQVTTIQDKESVGITNIPKGNCDYYNNYLKYLGSSDQAGNKKYIVTDKKEKKRIKKNHDQNTITSHSKINSAIELPSLAVRQEIGAASDRSETPTKDDKSGGFHEEGGFFGKDKNNNELAVPASAGAKSNPGPGKKATLKPFSSVDPKLKKQVKTISGTYHIHPSGTKPKANDPTQSEAFQDGPCGGDIPAQKQLEKAGIIHGNSYVVNGSKHSKKVTIYNGDGSIVTGIPLKKFRKQLKEN